MWKENTNFLCIKAGLTENTVWQNRIRMHGEWLAIKYMDYEHSIGHDESIWSFMFSHRSGYHLSATESMLS